MEGSQRQFRGTTFGGHGDTYQITSETGLDDLIVRSATSPLPRYHGSIPGDHTADAKTIILTVWWQAPPGEAEQLALQARALFQVSRLDQEEYRLQHQSGAESVVFVRVTRRSQPRSQDTEAVGLYTMTVEFEVTDPAIYSVAELAASLIPFEPAGGMEWPAVWPIDWGAAGVGAGTVITNTGEWETWPTIRIHGPDAGVLSNPIVESLATGQRLALTANGGASITAGQTLVISSHPADRFIRFVDGASRYGRLTADSEFFPLLAGSNELRFRASGDTAGATAQVTARSAWL